MFRWLAVAVALLSICSAQAAIAADDSLRIDGDFPGGNIVVESIEGDVVSLHQDLRDTPRFWFYWHFCVRGAEGRTLTFRFTQGNVFGERGPAVSRDQGKTWSWLGASAVANNSFRFSFTADDHDVRFCFAMPYTGDNLDRFLTGYSNRPGLMVEKLGVTRQGRPIQQLIAGRVDGKAGYRVLITCRHHACESTANYNLEGVIEVVLGNSDDGRWLREHVEFRLMPFMDVDGVEDGDQGKLRDPYDHWLDYRDNSRYESTRLLRDQFERQQVGTVHVALDLHCPNIRDGRIYFAVGPTPRNMAHTERLCKTLAGLQTGPCVYRAQDNMPYGAGWNVASSYVGRRSFAQWAEEQPGNLVAATVEFPYATVGGREVTVESARAFGRDLGRALRRFLESHEGSYESEQPANK